jgi:hypothetical protein
MRQADRKLSWPLGSVVVLIAISSAIAGVSAQPILILPDNDSETNDNTPTFSWSSVDGATSYHLQIDNDNDFSSPYFENNSITENTFTLPDANSLPAGTYYWRVASKDNGDSPSWSGYFVIRVTQPRAAGGVEFTLLLIFGFGAVFFIVGMVVGRKFFGGGGRIVEPLGPRPKVDDRQAHETLNMADDDTRRAGGMLKEVNGQDVDVSAEQGMLKNAQEFIDMARKEGRDGRHDSAFAYASAASALSSGVTSALKAKMEEARATVEARRKAEADIRAAEAAVKEVKSEIEEAESAGIDAKPASSLADLSSEIMKAAGTAKDPEIYRFQSSTARRIAEHAAAALKGSIAGQKDQVKRTEEAAADAKDALRKAEAKIEKGRKEFDTLVPEYWLKVAKEVYSIAEDKKVNAEAREAMADTSTKICEWIEDMFERRDIRSRMKKGGGITLR